VEVKADEKDTSASSTCIKRVERGLWCAQRPARSCTSHYCCVHVTDIPRSTLHRSRIRRDMRNTSRSTTAAKGYLCLVVSALFNINILFLVTSGHNSAHYQANFSFLPTYLLTYGSRHSVVGIVTGYGLVDRGIGVRVPVGSRISSFLRRPGRLWDPPSLLSNGYRG
jgi:hypothetical protein